MSGLFAGDRSKVNTDGAFQGFIGTENVLNTAIVHGVKRVIVLSIE
jgi:FlaA1/EpsC-like NDP-sugar epimerase